MQSVTIEFPCDYPIKVIGDSGPRFTEDVLAVMRKYDASISLDKVKERASRKGNYQAVTVLFWAMSENQIRRMFEELKTCDGVRMVL